MLGVCPFSPIGLVQGGHVQGPGRASWVGPQAVGPRWGEEQVEKGMEVAGFSRHSAPVIHLWIIHNRCLYHLPPQDVPPPALSLQLVDMGTGIQVHLF